MEGGGRGAETPRLRRAASSGGGSPTRVGDLRVGRKNQPPSRQGRQEEHRTQEPKASLPSREAASEGDQNPSCFGSFLSCPFVCIRGREEWCWVVGVRCWGRSRMVPGCRFRVPGRNGGRSGPIRVHPCTSVVPLSSAFVCGSILFLAFSVLSVSPWWDSSFACIRVIRGRRNGVRCWGGRRSVGVWVRRSGAGCEVPGVGFRGE